MNQNPKQAVSKRTYQDMLNTHEFIGVLNEVDTQKSGLLAKYKVALHNEKLISLIDTCKFLIVRNNEGLVSNVKQTKAETTDFSKKTTFFDFHTDGLYHDKLPELVILHCVNPGKKIHETAFLDTKEILSQWSEGDIKLAKKLGVVYIGRNGEEYFTSLIYNHPWTSELVFSYGSRAFLKPNVQQLSVEDLPNIKDIVRIGEKIHESMISADIKKFSWEENDLIIFDNLRFIHARYDHYSENDYARELSRIWLQLRKFENV